MKTGPGRYLKTGLRLLAFVAGSGIMGAVALHVGFARGEALVIMILGGFLSALATELPWGGFMFPADALLLCLCLLTGRNYMALAGMGAALAAGSLARGWGWAWVSGAVRNSVGVLLAVGVWRFLMPSWKVVTQGGAPALLVPRSGLRPGAFAVHTIPSLLLAALAFLVGATVVEGLLRRKREYSFGEFWLLNAGKNFHHLFFTLVLGAITAVAYRDLGIITFVLFALPVILTRDALKRSLDLRASRFEALKALSSSVDARDRYTYDHSNRVSRLVRMLAREMGFTESTVELIEGGALLHDIGKLGVDTEILSKPGPLDNEERQAVQRHPASSADVVSRVDLLKGSADIVKYHHERPDGHGYPDGLKGHQIPVGARILNVADAFDAMISDRPYRRRKTVEEAVEELRRGAGGEFDPVVVEYLVRLLAKRSDEILGSDAS